MLYYKGGGLCPSCKIQRGGGGGGGYGLVGKIRGAGGGDYVLVVKFSGGDYVLVVKFNGGDYVHVYKNEQGVLSGGGGGGGFCPTLCEESCSFRQDNYEILKTY